MVQLLTRVISPTFASILLPKIPWRSLPLTHTTLKKTSVRGPSLQFSWRAMLTSEADLKTFIEDVKFIRKLPTFSPHKEVVGEQIPCLSIQAVRLRLRRNLTVKEINPGPNVTTDEQIGGACFSRHLRICTQTISNRP